MRIPVVVVVAAVAAVIPICRWYRHILPHATVVVVIAVIAVTAPIAVTATTAVIAVIAAALGDTLGGSSILVVSSVSGLIDAHATAGTIASMHRSARVGSDMAELALLAAFSTNTVTKIVLASLGGSRGYALRVAAAVSSMAAMAWLGSWLGHLL